MMKRLLSLILVLLLAVMPSLSLADNDVTRAYDEALNAMKQGRYNEAVEKLAGISFYLDSVQLSLYCRAHAKAAEGDYDYAVEELQKLGSYRDAEKSAAYFAARRAEETAKTPAERAAAADLYDRVQINGFRDSTARAAAIRLKLYREGREAQDRQEWARAAEIFGALESYEDSAVRWRYTSGRMYEADGERAAVSYAYAVQHYHRAGGFLDSGERKTQCLAAAFEKAEQMIAAGNFDQAEKVYDVLGDFCDEERREKLKEARAAAAEAARQRRIAEADALVEENQFDEAREIYLEAGEPEMADEALYRKAAWLVQNGMTEEGASQYLSISQYKDSRAKHYLLGNALKASDPETASRILLADRRYPGAEDDLYEIALAASGREDYPLSISVYSEFQGKRDCTLRMMNDLYLYGLQLLKKDNPEMAALIFDQLEGVGSADLYANMARYAAAEALEAGGAYEAAANAFDLIADYADAADRAEDCRYFLALEKKGNGEYLDAAEIFAVLGDRRDSAEQEKECLYLQAGVYQEAALWEKAIALYESLNDYGQSRTRCRECWRQLGWERLDAGKAEDAYNAFVSAGDEEGKAKAAFAAGEARTAGMELEDALKWYRLATGLAETEERTSMIAQSLLNMEEDETAEQFASVVKDSEKSKAVLYALALRSLERKDEEAAMRQMKKAGDNADASERFQEMLNARVEVLVAAEKYDDAVYLCSAYGDQERAEEIRALKAQKEAEERQRALEAEEAERQQALEAEAAEHAAKAEEAGRLLAAGKYEEAAALYTEIGEEALAAGAIAEYEESREKNYLSGKALLDTDPEEAFRILAGDITYSDTQTVLYNLADRESAAGNYQLSSVIFETLAGQPLDPVHPLPDCGMRYVQDLYQYGIQLKARDEWEAAATVFDRLSGIGDAQARALECHYAVAARLEESGRYSQAAAAFDELGEYSDSAERVLRNRYNAAKKQMEEGDLDRAEAAFRELGSFSDAAMMVTECRYRAAEKLLTAGQYEEAREIYTGLGDYSGSMENLKECTYRIARQYQAKEQYGEAAAEYEKITEYRDTTDLLNACRSAIGDRQIEKAEALLRGGETENAVSFFVDAYDEYALVGDTEKMEALALMTADCCYSLNRVDESLVWYRKAGHDGKHRIAEVAEFACRTEQYETAEALAMETGTDEGREILYRLAEQKLAAGDEEAALRLFEEAGQIRDAEYRHDTILYQRALGLMEQRNYLDALDLFELIPDYEGVEEKKKEALYGVAIATDRTEEMNPEDLAAVQNAKQLYVNELVEKQAYEEAAAILENMDQTAEVAAQVLDVKYKLAEVNETAGNYGEAISIFSGLGGYRDAAARADAARYQQAMAYKASGQYTQAIGCFRLIPAYQDAREQITDCTYLLAGALTAAGEYRQALETYWQVIGYRDVKEILTHTEGLKAELAAWQQSLQPGDKVRFGDYAWIVLDKSEGNLLLITEDVTGEMPFMEGTSSRTTWQHSTLRTYLNGEFLDGAFSEAEKQAIQLTKVKAVKSPDSKASPGNNTDDYVYILNQQETSQYNDILNELPGTINWWIRSPGADNNIKVYSVGTGRKYIDSIPGKPAGVRPVLWVREDAVIVSAGIQEISLAPAAEESGHDSLQVEGKPWIGVSVRELTEEDVKAGWPCPGLLITEVNEGGPAETAGLQPGDIIVAMNTLRVQTIEEFRSFMTGVRAKQNVLVKIRHALVYKKLSDGTVTFRYDAERTTVLVEIAIK